MCSERLGDRDQLSVGCNCRQIIPYHLYCKSSNKPPEHLFFLNCCMGLIQEGDITNFSDSLLHYS